MAADVTQVEAEEVYEVSEKYNVASVPFFVFFKVLPAVLAMADRPIRYAPVPVREG